MVYVGKNINSEILEFQKVNAIYLIKFSEYYFNFARYNLQDL